ncbi:MAG: cell division protein FtsZ [Prevotellaceae bacterium]|jgi:cell division protein FtsZ|nr:cell division protein FtsZ [Prevotellaceae bacterium]
MNEYIPIGWDQKLSHIIKVIGVGGGGNNAVKNMYEKGIEGVDFIICNTDAQVLGKSPVQNKIQLGIKLTGGLGTGCNPELGRQAALESLDEIKEVLEQNTKMLFIASGLGGGTGTGAAPIIAKEARNMGILTVAIVTLPFKDEGEEPYKRAINGLQSLRENVDSLLIINSEKLYDIYPDISIFEAFPKADDIVTTAAKSIAEIITVEGYINVDFADVKMVMSNSDMALMGLGRAAGENRVRKAAEQALNSPLLNNNDISGAKNILVNVSSGLKNPLKTSELRELMDYINNASGRGANFKRGVTKDESLDADSSDAEISVTIIATGFSMNNSFPDINDDINEHPLTRYVSLVDSPVDVDNDPDNLYNPDDYSGSIELTDPAEEIHLTELTGLTELTNRAEEHSADRLSPSAKLPKQKSSSWNESEISLLENVPAYNRTNVKITMGMTAAKEKISRYSLDESGENYILSDNNSFLDRDVD